MNKFQRGTVVRHKVMGRGVVIDNKNGFVHVRMENGLIQEYYPEELVTEDDYDAHVMSQVPKEEKNWNI